MAFADVWALLATVALLLLTSFLLMEWNEFPTAWVIAGGVSMAALVTVAFLFA